MITLEVIGIPAPQGSKTRMPNGAMVDGTSKTGRAKLVEWRRAVADAARAYLTEHPQSPLSGPLAVEIEFRFPVTKSDPYRHFHAVTPDMSKVLRATEDALKDGGLIADDRLIATAYICKRWCQSGQMPGATIGIQDLSEVEALQRRIRKSEAEAERDRLKAAPTFSTKEGQLL